MLDNFIEHTRCPEALLAPLLAANGRRASHDDARTGLGRRDQAAERLLPAEAEKFISQVRIQLESDGNGLPLSAVDPAINVLRLERYIDNSVQHEDQEGVKRIVRKSYYMMRPLFPVSFRKYLQRMALRGWDAIPFPAWPVDLTTEQIIESVWKRLLQTGGEKEIPFIWFWPEGRSSGCIMTHDVETKAGRDFCAVMMQMESRHGIRTAFEIVPEERYDVPDEYLEQIRDSGCEVCIHGLNHDGHLFSSEDIFRERAEKINLYAENWGATGFRSPVLYRNLDWLHALNFSYDMSVPNVGHLDPQRGGCCTVFPYFIGDILELPLTTIQDYSLFNILQQRSLDLWKQQVGMIRERNGLISFIIHPDYMTEAWSGKLYDQLLEYLSGLRSEQGVWIALPREVNDWWRARAQLQLIYVGGQWKIRGPQAERARVAYASLEEGRVVYRVDARKAIADEEEQQ